MKILKSILRGIGLFFLIIVLPVLAGVLIYCYVEVFFILIAFVPGLIAFFGETLNNGSKMN